MVLTLRVARVKALTAHESRVRGAMVHHFAAKKVEPWIEGMPARYHPSVSEPCKHHEDYNLTHRHSWDCAPEYYKFNDRIIDCYRTVLSPFQAVRSIVHLHSETMNILTHGFALLWYLALLLYISAGPGGVLDFHMGIPSLVDSSREDQRMFTIMMAAYTVTWLFSTIFHTFNCCGPQAYYKLLSLDLCGLTFTYLGYMLAPIYYMFYESPLMRSFYLGFVALAVGTTAYLVLLDTSGFLMKGGEFARVMTFGTLAASGFVPVLHKALLDWSDPVAFEALKALMGHLTASTTILLLGGLCYVFRFPDTFLPRGSVNIFIQGHSLMHIFVSIAPLIQYVGTYGYYLSTVHAQCRTEWWPLPFE